MNSECSICFEIVRSNEKQKPMVTRCGHLFHDTCINSCLQNGKCPQCNQPIGSGQLIRLYINEPECSARAKDELIEQLRNQLHELKEKAQLQYDLIASLNRQINLEKELSLSGTNGGAGKAGKALGSQKGIVAPAKLNSLRKNFGNSTGQIQRTNVSDASVAQRTERAVAFRSNYKSSTWDWEVRNKSIINKLSGNGSGKFGNSVAVDRNVFEFGSDAKSFFKETDQPSFKFPIVSPKSVDQIANSVASTTSAQPAKSHSTFSSSIDGFSDFSSKYSSIKMTSLKTADWGKSTGSNAVSSSSKSSRCEGEVDSGAVLSVVSHTTDDDLVQDASDADAPLGGSESNPIDLMFNISSL